MAKSSKKTTKVPVAPAPVIDPPNPVLEHPVLAWHIASSQNPITKAPGEKLIHDGELKLCRAGFHASFHLDDTLDYGSSDQQGFNKDIITRVQCAGEYITDKNLPIHEVAKFVCRERTIIWSATYDDIRDDLVEFVRLNTVRVMEFADFPSIVKDFIRTNDQSILNYAVHSAEDFLYNGGEDGNEIHPLFRFQRRSRSNNLIRELKESSINAVEYYMKLIKITDNDFTYFLNNVERCTRQIERVEELLSTRTPLKDFKSKFKSVQTFLDIKYGTHPSAAGVYM